MGRTIEALSFAALSEANVKLKAVLEAGVGGSFWRQVPSAPAIATKLASVFWGKVVPLLIVVVTFAPGAVKPQTTAC